MSKRSFDSSTPLSWLIYLSVGAAFYLAGALLVFGVGLVFGFFEIYVEIWAAIGACGIYAAAFVAPAPQKRVAIRTVVVANLLTTIVLFGSRGFLMQLSEGVWILLVYLPFPLIVAVLAWRRFALAPIGRLGASEGKYRRYKGITPFQDEVLDRATFFGRDRESRSLLSLVLAEPLVVFFAKSGMGKSSLINASLLAGLRQHRYLPLVVRLADRSESSLAALCAGVRTAATEARTEVLGGEETSAWTFFKTLELWSKDEELLKPVLILDQFEEIFTLHDASWRRELIGQLAAVTRGLREPEVGVQLSPSDATAPDSNPPDLKIVIVLREDFLADLEELAPDIPGIFKCRFRLGPLSRDQARAAILEPAALENADFETAPFSYRPEVVDQILSYLSKIRHGAQLGDSDEVEPAQLQLICQYLEEFVGARALPGVSGDPREIRLADVGGEAELQRILESFYERTLAGIRSDRHRRRVRWLCEHRLISSSGRRLTEDGEEIAKLHKVPESQLQKLVSARLLRSETRLGGTFYELSHDSLVGPVRSFRQKRRQWWRSVVVSVVLVLAFHGGYWWIREGRIVSREAAAIAIFEIPIPPPATEGPRLLAARQSLEAIKSRHREWLWSRNLLGRMLDHTRAVGLELPELKIEAERVAGQVRDAFSAHHQLTPPGPKEDVRLNPRMRIEAGSFLMGSPDGEGHFDEHQQHPVSLRSPFLIQAHEVTNREYRRFDPTKNRAAADNLPVTDISFFEAKAYAGWIGGRLPTEAEWEMAARAGKKTPYFFGDDPAELQLYAHFQSASPASVARRRKNAWGLYDVYGNVWEWVSDYYHPSYPAERQEDPNPPKPPDHERRVVRGGGFRSPADQTRSAYREDREPTERWLDVGFRVAFSAETSRKSGAGRAAEHSPALPNPEPAPSASPGGQ